MHMPLLPPSHKLSARSLPCILLGFSNDDKGYHCLDLLTGHVYVSHHVTFPNIYFPSLHVLLLHLPTLPPTPRSKLLFRQRLTPSSLPQQRLSQKFLPRQHPNTHPATTLVEAAHTPDSSAAATASSSSAAMDASTPTPLIHVRDIPITVPQNDHTMRTHGKYGFHLPTKCLNLHADALFLLYQKLMKPPFFIRIGLPPCKMNLMPCRKSHLATCSFVLLTPTLFLENGSFVKSFIRY
jgi:hypothetical protein